MIFYFHLDNVKRIVKSREIPLYHRIDEHRRDNHVDYHAHDIVGHRDKRASGYGWVDLEFLEHDGHAKSTTAKSDMVTASEVMCALLGSSSAGKMRL